MSSLVSLPDLLLIEAYFKAIDIGLESSFIDLLFDELTRRGLEVSEEKEAAII